MATSLDLATPLQGKPLPFVFVCIPFLLQEFLELLEVAFAHHLPARVMGAEQLLHRRWKTRFRQGVMPGDAKTTVFIENQTYTVRLLDGVL